MQSYTKIYDRFLNVIYANLEANLHKISRAARQHLILNREYDIDDDALLSFVVLNFKREIFILTGNNKI